jgi:hypothetical protein
MESSTYDDSSGMPAEAKKALCGNVSAITEGEMDSEVLEALRSAQELCAYLWNNTDANAEANVELVAHSDRHAEQLAALLNDARERVEVALHGLEIQQDDIGATANRPHGPVSEQMMRRFYGPPK